MSEELGWTIFASSAVFVICLTIAVLGFNHQEETTERIQALSQAGMQEQVDEYLEMNR